MTKAKTKKQKWYLTDKFHLAVYAVFLIGIFALAYK